MTQQEKELHYRNARRQAVRLAKRGTSYRKIAKQVGLDESAVRRNPEVRKARMKADPEAHSELLRPSAASCRALSVPERMTRIERELKYLLDIGMYRLSAKDQTRLTRIMSDGLKKVGVR